YGYHKMISETICREYCVLFGIPISIVRPFSIFGKGLRKQLLWDICNKFKKDDPVMLFGTGDETRDFIHIDDFMLLIEKVLLSSGFKGEVYNAASGNEISIKTIAEIFERYHGHSRKIAFNGNTKKGDPLQWKADVSKAKELGFSAS